MFKQSLIVVSVILISCAFSTQMLSQTSSIKNAFDIYAQKNLKNNYNDLFFLTRNSLDKPVIGDPYLDDWKKAFLIDKDSNVFTVKARYRIFDDEFQILVNGETKAVYPNLIKGIVFEDKAFVALERETEDGLIYSFFELMVEGEINLLKQYNLFTKNKKGNIIITGSSSKFYYQQEDELAYKLPNSSSKLEEFLVSRKGDDIKRFIKSQSLDFSSESDLIKMFNYCNTL